MILFMTLLILVSAGVDDLEPADQEEGLDLWVLFGSLALFLIIVVVITMLRRWK
jgi:hypothetical protein